MDLERKNANLDKDLLFETHRHVDRKVEIDELRAQLMTSQLRVSQICSVESKEISSLQRQRDVDLATYAKTINQLAKDKAKRSPEKRIADLAMVKADLRVLNKKNANSKNFVEYKAS